MTEIGGDEANIRARDLCRGGNGKMLEGVRSKRDEKERHK